MRHGPFPTWLGLSLAVHAAAFGMVVRRSRATDAAATSAMLAGDTLEVPGLEALSEESDVDLDTEPAPSDSRDRANDPSADNAATPAPRRRMPKLAMHGAPAAASSATKSGDAEPARFGAVGERGTFDLATAFTIGFPTAASALPEWSRASFGATGAVDVTLVIDAEGHLVEADLGSGGTPALRASVARTIALIRGRTFTARQARTRLHVVGAVTPKPMLNDEGVATYGVAKHFEGRSGVAGFSLASGRRVEVTITER